MCYHFLTLSAVAYTLLNSRWLHWWSGRRTWWVPSPATSLLDESLWSRGRFAQLLGWDLRALQQCQARSSCSWKQCRGCSFLHSWCQKVPHFVWLSSMAGSLQGMSHWIQQDSRNLLVDVVRFGRGGHFLPDPDGNIPASAVICLHTWFNSWLDILGNNYEWTGKPPS